MKWYRVGSELCLHACMCVLAVANAAVLLQGPEGRWMAVPYILAFYIVIPIIMLNLFTAVIIENFEKQQEQDAWCVWPGKRACSACIDELLPAVTAAVETEILCMPADVS